VCGPARRPKSEARLTGFLVMSPYIYRILSKREVKITGFWPSIFFSSVVHVRSRGRAKKRNK